MLTRRRFVGSGLAAGLACTLGSRAFASRSRPGASDELGVAVVGLRGRGRDHVESFRSLPGVRVVAICDVDQAVLGAEAERLAQLGTSVASFVDVRELLEREDVDAVSIATPNHWHALIAVWACQAGKHVYVEKPVAHNVWEGRQIVRAARKHARVVQAGMQCRSSSAIADAIRWLHEGHLGRIQLARGLCYKPRQSIGRVDGPQPVPATVDYELWTGPAPLKPLLRANLHYDWHWIADTGNGDLGNQGVHQMDLARWALGESRAAPQVLSIGGRVGYDDDGETPNTQLVLHLYERAPLLFEVRGLPRDLAAQQQPWGQGMDSFLDARIGVIVHCQRGWLRIPDYSSAQAFDEGGQVIRSWQGADDHFANFVAAVKSGRREDLDADIEEGHQSSVLCHLGQISHALGRPASSQEIRSESASFEPLAAAFERVERHLAANGVDLARTPLTLGRGLDFDPAWERFRGSPEADRLLSREHRQPFVVPAV